MLTAEQQRMIISSVLAGCTWPSAALAAGATPEQLAEFVQQAKEGRCKLKFRFVTRLKQAGKEATEASLRQHQKEGIRNGK